MDSERTGEEDIGHLKDVAAGWVLREHSGEWTEADVAELSRWMKAATTHRVAYLRAKTAWNEVSRLKALGAGLAPGTVPGPTDFMRSPFFKQQPVRSATPMPHTLRRVMRMPLFLAASMLLAIGGYFAWYRGTLASQDYSTVVGVTSAIPLPDGSKVTLNTDSEIRVSVTQAVRAVTLDQGEAFFEVAKDPNRPFTVRVGETRIVVLGTKFSVRRLGEEVQVAVTEGRVWVDDTQIAAGDVARVKAARVAVEQRPLSEVEELLSWRSGFVVFHETPLSEAVAQFNRYNEKQIVIRDSSVGGLKVSGNFKANYVDSFIGLLEDGFPLTVERQDRRIVLKAIARE